MVAAAVIAGGAAIAGGAMASSASKKAAKTQAEPYRVCRRPSFLRDYPDEKSKIYP